MEKRYALLEKAVRIVEAIRPYAGELPVERTWSAVEAVPKTGEIVSAWVYHVEGDKTYSHVDFPVTILLDNTIRVAVRGKNTSPVDVRLK